MVIDLKRCIGCWSCVIACKIEHGLSPGFFRTYIREREIGEYPAKKIVMPTHCNHCKNPQCICPNGATVKREDGIVYVDPEKCNGCRQCIDLCPYGARYYIDKFREWFPQHITPYEEVKRKYSKLREGIVDKCDFCVDRVSSGLKRGLKPGIDRDATPVCVITCPAKAKYFGDLDDPTSEVSVLISEKRGQQFDLANTDPSIYYLLY